MNQEMNALKHEVDDMFCHNDEIASIHIGLSSDNKDNVIYYIYGDEYVIKKSMLNETELYNRPVRNLWT